MTDRNDEAPPPPDSSPTLGAEAVSLRARSQRQIVIELSRADTAPQLARYPTTKYRRRWPGGITRDADFAWSAENQERLAALTRVPPDRNAAAKLQETLRKLLDDLEVDADEKVLDPGRRAQIVFRFDARELLALPWELAPFRGAHGSALGQSEDVSIQYEMPGTSTRLPETPPDEGGTILLAWNGDVPAADHRTAIEEACRAAGHPPAIALENASLRSLREEMDRVRPAVLHLLCHGEPIPSASPEGGARSYGLRLRDERGPGDRVVASSELRAALEPHAASLRLVVLNACWGSAAGGLDSALGSVAEELHALGIQSVIASRFALSEGGSITFTRELYGALLPGGLSLQDAVSAARRKIAQAHSDTHDWAAYQLFARVQDRDLRPFVARPYRGLLSFGEAHARYYCGRERETEEAVGDVLKLLSTPGKPRLLAITGASGRGKSSFVVAGLVPRLRELLPGATGKGRIVTRTLRPSEGLAALEGAVLAAGEGETLLLVLDQLEEVFTTLRATDRRPYVAALWAAATSADRTILVLASLRVDYIARCGDFPLPGGTTLEHLLYEEAHHVFLGPLRPDDLRRIIETPARRAGLRLQEGLSNQILRDAGDEPGSLPLIEYVLDELWKQRSGGELTLQAYEALSGVKGALAAQAEEALRLLDPAPRSHGGAAGETADDDLYSLRDGPDRRLAKRLLVRLVSVSEGAAQATRKVVRLSELTSLFAGEEERLRHVLDELTRKRLLVARAADEPGQGGETFVEIAHEALIRDWKKLGQWVETYRLANRDLEHFERMAASLTNILRGEELSHLARVIATSGREATRALHGLLHRSKDEEERRRRSERWHRIRVGAVAVIASLWAAGTTVLGVWAWRKGGEASVAAVKAEDSAARARRESLVSGARALVARKQPVWAAKLLLSVDHPELASGWVDVANEVLERRLPHRTYRGAGAVLSADGTRVATADTTAPTATIELADGTGTPVRLVGHSAPITGLAWSLDGARLATSSEDGTVRVWNTREPGRFVLLESGLGPIKQPVFSLDGHILSAIAGGQGLLFRADGGAPPGSVTVDGSPVQSIRPGPDGRFALVRAESGRTEVWTLDPAVPCEGQGTSRPCRVKVLAERSRSAGFSADGWRAFVSDMERTLNTDVMMEQFEETAEAAPGESLFELRPSVSLWSAGAWDAPPQTIELPGVGSDKALRYDRVEWVDGASWLVTGRESAALRGEDGSTIKRLLGRDPVAVSRDGRAVASTGQDGVSVTSKETSSRRIDLWSGTAEPEYMEIHNDGSLVLTSSAVENVSRIFRTGPDGAGVAMAQEDQGMAYLVEYLVLCAGERHAMVGWGDDGTFLWDVGAGGPATRLAGRAAAFSLDGRRVLTLDRGRALVHDTHAPGAPRALPIDAEANDCQVADARFDATGERVILVCENTEVREASASSPGPSRLLGAPTDCVPDGGPILADTGKAGLFYCSAADVRVLREEGEIRLSPVCDDSREWVLTNDGETAVCAAGDGVIVFTLDAPDRAAVWAGWGAPVLALGATVDSRRIWAVTADNTVRVLDLQAPSRPLLVARHPQGITSVVFDARGETVVTSSLDGWVRVYRLGEGGEPYLLDSRGKYTFSLQMAVPSDDGKRVLVASSEGTLRFYDLSIPDLKAGLSANVDCLPPEMRRLYLGETTAEATSRHVLCERERGR